MPSPLKTAWANPWVRRPLKLAGLLAALVAAGYLLIDVLGAGARRDFEAQIAREGESLDFKALLPPAVAEEQNFCAIPALRNLAANKESPAASQEEGRRARERLKEILSLDSKILAQDAQILASRYLPEPAEGTGIAFESVAAEMRSGSPPWMPALPGAASHDVNAGLATKWDPLVAALAAGLARPRAQWMPPLRARLGTLSFDSDIDYFDLSMSLARAVTFRGAAAGNVGDFRTAAICLHILGRLLEASSDELEEDGFVVWVEGMAGVVWEMSRANAGTPAGLANLEPLFVHVDLQRASWRARQMRLAREWLSVSELKHPHDSAGLVSDDRTYTPWYQAFIPSGVYDSAGAAFGHLELQYFLLPLRDRGAPGLLPAHQAYARELRSHDRLIWNFPTKIADNWMGSGVGALTTLVRNQALLNQATIACVLERVRAATGSYPGSLEGLTLWSGAPLPLDPVIGQPMHYRPSGARYILWSVGPDGLDDHAVRIPRQYHESVTSADWPPKGDWVWSYEP